MLNAVIRHEFKSNSGYVNELVDRIHSLALIVDEPAIVSTCGQYVARPAMRAAIMAVQIDRIVTDQSDVYIKAEAWADALKRYEETKPVEYDA